MIPAARGVEPPVLRHTVVQIDISLHRVVLPALAARSHLKHKVRRPAHLACHVPVAGHYRDRVDSERHHTVGRELLRIVARISAQVATSRDQNIVSLGEVESKQAAKGVGSPLSVAGPGAAVDPVAVLSANRRCPAGGRIVVFAWPSRTLRSAEAWMPFRFYRTAGVVGPADSTLQVLGALF